MLDNVNRSVDDLYGCCESAENQLECEEVISLLAQAKEDFEALIARFKMQTEFEKARPEAKPKSISWSVRKVSPVAAKRPLNVTSATGSPLSIISWADRVAGVTQLSPPNLAALERAGEHGGNPDGDSKSDSDLAEELGEGSGLSDIDDAVAIDDAAAAAAADPTKDDGNDSCVDDADVTIGGGGGSSKDSGGSKDGGGSKDTITTMSGTVTAGTAGGSGGGEVGEDVLSDPGTAAETVNTQSSWQWGDESDGDQLWDESVRMLRVVQCRTAPLQPALKLNSSSLLQLATIDLFFFSLLLFFSSFLFPLFLVVLVCLGRGTAACSTRVCALHCNAGMCTVSLTAMSSRLWCNYHSFAQASSLGTSASRPSSTASLLHCISPGGSVLLHQKLSSPSRKKTKAENARLSEERQTRASETRKKRQREEKERLQTQNTVRVNAARDRRSGKEKKVEKDMVQKMQRAEVLRDSHIEGKRRKAQEEDAKVNEISFINRLEEQNKKQSVVDKLNESQERLKEREEVRERKAQENAGRIKAGVQTPP